MTKKFLAGTMAAVVAVSSLGMMMASADEEKDIFVNGTQLEIDAFEDENGKVMVPVRAVCEALDMEVVWNAEAKRVEISKLPHYVTFSPVEDGYTFARTAPMMLGTAPQLLGDGVTYVPSEFFGEILPSECEITEDAVKISYGEIPTTEYEIADEVFVKTVLVTAVEENKLTVYDPDQGEVIVHMTEETVVTGEKEALTAGRLVDITYSPAMTMSLPPITNAESVTILADMGDFELVETTVTAIEEEGILVGEGENEILLVKAEDFSALDAEGNEISEFKAGDKITAIVSMASTMSIPPQRNVIFIRVNG